MSTTSLLCHAPLPGTKTCRNRYLPPARGCHEHPQGSATPNPNLPPNSGSPAGAGFVPAAVAAAQDPSEEELDEDYLYDADEDDDTTAVEVEMSEEQQARAKARASARQVELAKQERYARVADELGVDGASFAAVRLEDGAVVCLNCAGAALTDDGFIEGRAVRRVDVYDECQDCGEELGEALPADVFDRFDGAF